MGNRTYFKKAKENQMSWKDIFSDVRKKHTKEETDRVLIAGTSLTTPKEEEMLAGWQKPFVFARFFLIYLIGLFALLILYRVLQHPGGAMLLMIGLPCIFPLTMLLLVWEMHIPRSISLVEVIEVVAIGGILSLIVAVIGFNTTDIGAAILAGVIEEPAKIIIAFYFLKRRNRKYILDGILIGVAVGAGFAMLESIYYSLSSFYTDGLSAGVSLALLRCVRSISSHAMYAGIAAGGLMLATKKEVLNIKHLLKPEFLKYFALAIVLHAINNAGDLGLPVFFGGFVSIPWLVKTIIGLWVLFSLIKKGVNQVVMICIEKNAGRVTVAVNRKVAPIQLGEIPKGENMHAPIRQAHQHKLIIEGITGPYKGKSYQMREGTTISIGRLVDKNDIGLGNCASVSGMHCSISARSGRLYVKDLNSTNGTYVGSTRLLKGQEIAVIDGQMLYLGSRECGFRIHIES
ncbi:MAG: PrsW family intramembrane metalloprotease [Eubacterium sp.]|nr:PrsW family intramembrane metalloprotease [Eubacterium sp.]